MVRTTSEIFEGARGRPLTREECREYVAAKTEEARSWLGRGDTPPPPATLPKCRIEVREGKIYLDGVQQPVNLKADTMAQLAEYLTKLIAAPLTVWVPTDGARVDRWLAKCPLSWKLLIESQPGAGYRLTDKAYP